MAKLMDEKVLQQYFQERENWEQYEVEINGRMERITSVVKGEDFPDLECRITGVRGLVLRPVFTTFFESTRKTSL